MSDEFFVSGITTFEGWEEKFGFILFDDDGDLHIVLVDRSGKQWGTGYLKMEKYLTAKNRIADITVRDYTKLFRNILVYSNDTPSADSNKSDSGDVCCQSLWGEASRTLKTLAKGALQLNLTIRTDWYLAWALPPLGGSSWTVNYVFYFKRNIGWNDELDLPREVEDKLRELQQEMKE